MEVIPDPHTMKTHNLDDLDIVPQSTLNPDVPPVKGSRSHFLSQNAYDQVLLYKTKYVTVCF